MLQSFFVAENKEYYTAPANNTYYGTAGTNTYYGSGVGTLSTSGVATASSSSAQATVANDIKQISISPGDVVYFVDISFHQFSYCYGFHYKSLKFFEFSLDNLSLFRPILIEKDVIDMNLKYNNHNELEPHLRPC